MRDSFSVGLYQAGTEWDEGPAEPDTVARGVTQYDFGEIDSEIDSLSLEEIFIAVCGDEPGGRS